MAALLVQPALAANECGPGPAATCGPGTYGSGITYSDANANITLEPGVNVTGANGVSLNGSGSQTLTINAGTPAVTINSSATGINVGGASGAVNIIAGNSSVTVTGAGSNGYTAFTTSGTVNLTTDAITVTQTATDGFGIFAGSNNGTVNVNTVAGDLVTHSDGGVGIYGQTLFGALNITTGNVTITGNSIPADAVYGIYTRALGAGGTTTVAIDTTAGAVNLSGTSTSHAIFAQASNASGNASLSVKTADVTTNAAGAYAISAQTNGAGANGTVVIDSHLGTITTHGAGAIGINAYIVGSPLTGPITVTAGNVTTTGTGSAHGIRIGGIGTLSATAGAVSTAGDGAIGILINAQNGTLGAVTGGYASIETQGVGAHALQISQGGIAEVTGTGAIVTNGNTAAGVLVDKSNNTSTTLNLGTVTTHGTNAPGIHVFSGAFSGNGTGGAVSITANAVTTTGDSAPTGGHYQIGVDSYGIEVRTEGAGANGAVTIDTSAGVLPGTLGSVSVDGYKATAIDVRSGTQALGQNGAPIGGGPITITVGNVTANGDFGAGIDARTFGTGAAVNITALGAVAANGLNLFNLVPPENEGNSRPMGISGWALNGGDVTITTHDVTSTGDSAPAVSGQSDGGNLTIDTTAGSILAKGSSTGVIATYGNSFGGTAVVKAVRITTADVTTMGAFAAIGVHGQAGGPDASLSIDTTAGTVSTVGSVSAGINAVTGGVIDPANTVPLTLRTGTIRTEGTDSAGINITASGGTVDLIAFGPITALQSNGINSSNYGAGLTTIDVRGGIASGGNAIELGNKFATPGTNVVLVSSAVSATGNGSHGIFGIVGPTIVTVAPGGSIAGADRAISLAAMVNGTSVTNNGTLTGNGGVAVEFIGGTAQTFTNGGTVNGDVWLGGGDDTALLLAGTVLNGNLDGQGGTDTFQLGGTGSGSFDPSRALNFEAAQKTGTGSWSLTGNGTTLTSFDVQQGRLAVNGTFPTMGVTVQSGAVLAGTGTMGPATILPGGIHAPGNSIGVETVAGNYVNNGTLQIEVDPASADKVVVTGDVDITGATLEVMELTAIGWQPSQSYTIIDNQGGNPVVGTFATVRNVYAFLAPSVVYTADDGNNVALTLVRNAIPFAGLGLTPNEIAAGQGAESTGFGSPLQAALLGLTVPEVPDAFDQISGEIHASAKLAMLRESRYIREAVLERTFVLLAKRAEQGAWLQGYGGYSLFPGDGNAARMEVGSGGLIFGGDAVAANGWSVGVAVGAGRSVLSVPARNASASEEKVELAFYGSGAAGPFDVRMGAALTHHEIETTRTPAFTGFTETLTARYGANTAQVFGTIGYPIALENDVTLEPFIGIAGILHETSPFSETGGISAVSSGGSLSTAAVVTLGVTASTQFQLGNGMAVEAHGTLAWKQAFGANPTATNTFAGGAPFTVAAASPAGGALALELGAGIALSDNARLDLTYSGEMGQTGLSHAAKATLHVAF